jgi:hypothetical protein
MDQIVPRKLSTRQTHLRGILNELQWKIAELRDLASVLSYITASHWLASSSDPLTLRPISDIDELILAIESFLQYWEGGMWRILYEVRSSIREEPSSIF